MSSSNHQYGNVPSTSPIEQTLNRPRKGGILGKKRGKYKGDSRVTKWRRTKANIIAEAKNATKAPLDTPVSDNQRAPDATLNSPTSNQALLGGDENPAPTDYFQSMDEAIADLKRKLSQVKNKRSYPHSAYDCLRHLSILRFFEWTSTGQKQEQEAARELAVLLWEHKTGVAHDARNSINRKASLIQEWAREYRSTGELKEHTHGTHKKTESTLAKEEIAKAAKKALVKMSKPSPGLLKQALLTEILPKFGIQDGKISENTCRLYMQEWGWTKGKYREWIPRYKKLVDPRESESDDDHDVSDETAVLGPSEEKEPEVLTRKGSAWHAPIPSPTTAILSVPTKHTTTISYPACLDGLQNSINPASPNRTLADSNIGVSDRNSPVFWTQPQNYQPHQPQIYPFQMSTTFPNPPELQHQSQQYMPPPPPPPSATHPPHRYVPKSLDGLVPDLPMMLGVRPAINGAPVPLFSPDPSTMSPFIHGSTFPPQVTRRNSIDDMQSDFNPSLHLPFMQD